MAKKTKSEELVKTSKHYEIFKLYKGEDGKIQIVVGNNIVCAKRFETFTQADNYIGTKPYELILTTAALNAHYLYLKLQNDLFIKVQNDAKTNETAKAAEETTKAAEETTKAADADK